MTELCHICGNELDGGRTLCPYCGSRQERQAKKAAFLHKTVNIEWGKPLVETAIDRMIKEIAAARQEGVQVLTIIHGYGSSGKGGKIRVECRNMLDYLVGTSQIKGFINGENFSKGHGPVRELLRRFPALGSNRNLGRCNRGITIAVL
ncbi:MAG: hypothetical protein CSB24_04295 [Deltaproteobacteria bacterium]|nr:MAG: hypothetical protein CSB24_04295 [Deltaproteobacteria bacterium]